MTRAEQWTVLLAEFEEWKAARPPAPDWRVCMACAMSYPEGAGHECEPEA